jgi:rRNA maturation RNase YbeY
MVSINFFSEEIDFTPKNKLTIRKWIKAIVHSHQKKLSSINYIFTSDQYLHRINKEYLNHDTFTDIITFDHSVHNNKIAGDIYISVERVLDNSKKQKVSFEDELHRVLAHGVLHLLGLNDKTTMEKEEMRKKENHYLALRENYK